MDVERHAGFTRGQPWLPIPAEHANHAVDVQEIDPHSVLNSYRNFLAWRKEQTVLIEGDIEFVDASPAVLAFKRQIADKTLLVLFNLTSEAAHFDLGELALSYVHLGHGLLSGVVDEAKQVKLPPFASLFAEL
jgi:alpha-glucosidase